MPIALRLLVVAAMCLVLAGSSNPRAAEAASMAQVEEIYADAADAVGVLTTIDSGLFKTYEGKDRAAWELRYKERRKKLVEGLASLSSVELSERDAHALARMKFNLGYNMTEDASASALSFGAEGGKCSDASRKDLNESGLQAALIACFDEKGNKIPFEGRFVTRDSWIALLSRTEDPQKRKALFLSLAPLWEAVNGHDENDSPYRRRIKFAAATYAASGSPIDAVPKAIGLNSTEAERWLERILDTWRQVLPNKLVEPWDYRFEGGEADRVLADAMPLEKFLPINQRYYHDLGADPKELGILYDMEPRAGKAPVTYTDYVTMGRSIHGVWRTTVARVSASYTDSGLYLLNMMIHENGHAVHYCAIHNRPAFMDIGVEDILTESFADVTSWNVYDPAWQQKYLGRHASEAAGLRSQYTMVTLEAAWALFELRMLRKPDSDPNAVWTEITSHYLHIVPHPELSWWVQRAQLVSSPGFMMNYGLATAVIADMRQRVREAIGPYNTGNPQWYAWVSEHLLRFGTERGTAELLRDFLGRPVSTDALIADMRRLTALKDKGRVARN